MLRFTAVLLALGLAACSRTPTVNLVNGQAFWMGDDRCVNYRSLSAIGVQCFDSSNRPTEQRRALTSQELQVIGMRQQQEAMNMAALNASIAQMNAAYRPPAYPTYTAPQVQTYTQPQNAIVNCFQTGPVVHCR